MPEVTDSEARGAEETTCRLWWREQGIDRLIAGVFEGGGAKGLLYVGALEAMVEDAEHARWFSAVAGASAGAITATLIAAGLRPEQVGKRTQRALDALRKPTFLSGLRRVRDGVSYLDQDALLDWLRRVLEAQIRLLCCRRGGAGVSFKELYQMTTVELDVVAVDLERQRPIVFNHRLTPKCRVAEAVVASAAIPLAFEWMPLVVPGRRGGIVVDGGVMANFPVFVFKDDSFREWAGLPGIESSTPVVGFLLDEQEGGDRAEADVYVESSLFPRASQWRSEVEAMDKGDRNPVPDDFVPKRRKFRPRREERSTLGRLVRAVTRPMAIAMWPVHKLLFVWIPAFLRWNAGGAKGSWPQPSKGALRTFVNWFDQVVAGTRPWGVLVGGFAAVSVCMGFGAYFAAWRPLAGHIGDWIHGEVSILGGVLGLIFWIAWSVVPIYAWLVISIVFFGAALVHRTVQVTGYGLVKTFLQGPGAPPWAGKASDDHVVRLPVPKEITTLTVSLDEKGMAAALASVREATRTKLRQLERERTGR
jgi:NTE family protein